MKLTKFTNLLALGLVLSVAALGCKKTPVGVTKLEGGAKAGSGPEVPGGQPVTTGENPSGTSTGLPSNPADLHAGWPQNREIFKANTVHFAFDSSVVRASEKPNLVAVADYLKANSADAVLIEGHCDERGTAGYNQALGERRALALREELVRLSIDATRVDTISFGFEKPVDTGHDEAAWAKNRRGEFVVLTPPAK